MSTAWLGGSRPTPSPDADCSLARLRAVAKNCRMRGGQCDCPSLGSCKAVELGSQSLCRLAAERTQLERKIKYVENIVRRVQTRPATLRKDFQFREGMTPVVVFDGDEATFGYEDQNGAWVESDEWPFNESSVWADDCSRHGIKVE